MMNATPTSACINMLTHCPQCGAEYRNIQHPLKPLGVNMARECDCKSITTYVTDAYGNSIGTVTKVAPPKT